MTDYNAPKKTARLSQAGTQQTQQFSALVKGYKALSMADKTSWITLAQSVNISAGRTGSHKLSALNLYTKINTIRIACSQPILSTGPAAIIPAQSLPQSLQVTADTHLGFTCGIISPIAYTGYLRVEAAPIAPAGYSTYSAKSFRILGTINGLTQGSTPVASLFTARYGTPPPGSEIVLQLIPMSITGDRLPGRIITGVVLSAAFTNTNTDTPEHSSEDSDETSTLRAA